jgi:hypothetical protein
MMNHAVFEFTKGHYGMHVKCHTDHGWNEGLGCGGRVGWEDEVALNDDDAALFRIRNIENNESISVCGMKHWRGMTFSAVVLSETNTSFGIIEEHDRVVVRVYGKHGKPGKTAVDYTPEEAPPVK